MKSRLLYFGCWLPLCAHAGTPFLVDLDKNPNLTGIFESGLRPLNVRGLENKLCEIRPAQEVAFKAGGLETPAYLAAWEFRLNGAGRVISIRGYSEQAWTVGEAYQMMAPMEKVLGGDPPKMLVFLQGYPQTSTNGDMWGNRFLGPDGLRIGYYFRHSMQATKPFLVTFYVDWNLPSREHEKGSDPLKPPPGYEDFDMRPLDVQNYEKYIKEQALAAAVPAKNPALTGTSPPVTPPGIWHWWPWLLLVACVLWLGKKLLRR